MSLSKHDRFVHALERMSSMVRKLFRGRKRKSTDESSAQEAINNIKDTEELLLKKQAHFEAKIAQENKTAVDAGTKNKRVAFAALKRKKLYEKELSRIDGVLTQLESQRTALENAGVHAEVLNVLSDANKTLKKANLDLDIDKVADLMDDITEQIDTSAELASAISQPLNGGFDLVGEDELEEELAKLQEDIQDAVEKKRPSALPALPDAPNVPLTRARAKKLEREDSGMADLEAWAAAN